MAATQKRLFDGKLKQLQAQPANKLCADCGDKGHRVIRFASVKLGVFLCNQCYAAHRSLGAHLTRGKVIGMDNFTIQDVEVLENAGNARVNAKYEATLTAGAKPPPTPCNGCSGCADCRQRLQYITAKYEHRKWYSDTPAPAPAPPPAKQRAAAPAAAAPVGGGFPVFGAQPPAPAPAPPPTTTDDLLGFFGAPVAPMTAPVTAPAQVFGMAAPAQDLFGGLQQQQQQPSAGIGKNEENCIKKEELYIKNVEMCIKTEEICI